MCTVLFDSLDPLFWCWVDNFAKEKIEEGQGIDDVEHDCSLVPDQSLERVPVNVADEMSKVVVHHSAEDQIDREAQYPAIENLIVCMNSMVDPAESNHETEC